MNYKSSAPTSALNQKKHMPGAVPNFNRNKSKPGLNNQGISSGGATLAQGPPGSANQKKNN